MELIETLKLKSASEAAKAESDWQALVTKLANGENVTEREATNILKSSGRSLDDLEAAVGREQRITELRDIVATLPVAAKKLQETTSAETAFNAERQAEFVRNREQGIVIRSAAMEARANFEAIGTAQRELDSLIDTPVELPLGEVA